jgi:hypothetical protein
MRSGSYQWSAAALLGTKAEASINRTSASLAGIAALSRRPLLTASIRYFRAITHWTRLQHGLQFPSSVPLRSLATVQAAAPTQKALHGL